MDQANELYWGSDASVNQIAEELDLSKGALYDLVRPLPSGLPCPRCGEEMEYPNRTARQRGFLTCPSCELEEEEEEVRLEWREAARDSGEDALVVSPGRGVETAAPPAGAVGKRVLWGTALLGAAAGVAVALWARRRS